MFGTSSTFTGTPFEGMELPLLDSDTRARAKPPPAYHEIDEHETGGAPRSPRPPQPAVLAGPSPPSTTPSSPPANTKNTPHRTPTGRKRDCCRALLVFLAWPVSLGLLIFGTVTYDRKMAHAVANPPINQDPHHWINEAKIRTYEPCYRLLGEQYDVGITAPECQDHHFARAGPGCKPAELWKDKDMFLLRCMGTLGGKYKNDEREAMVKGLQKKRKEGVNGLIAATVIVPFIVLGVVSKIVGPPPAQGAQSNA